MSEQERHDDDDCGGKVAGQIALPNGLTFYLPSRDMWKAAKFLYNEIFHSRRYGRPGFEIQPDHTIVDVGANMGLFVLWAAPQAPRGRVVAIEPMPNVAECMNMNVRRNGLENVTVLERAIGADGDTLELITYPDFNIVSHKQGVRPAWATRLLIRLLCWGRRAEPVRVAAPCISLGTIIEQLNLDKIDYLKIDCEGGEYQVFRTLSDEHWRRIDRVAMEFHDLEPGNRHPELVSILESKGFEVTVHKPPVGYYLMHFGEIWARRSDAARTA